MEGAIELKAIFPECVTLVEFFEWSWSSMSRLEPREQEKKKGKERKKKGKERKKITVV